MGAIPDFDSLAYKNESEIAGTATGSAGVDTLNEILGVVTTEALATASLGTATRTLNNTFIHATGGRIFVFLIGGTNTTQGVVVSVTAQVEGSATIKFYNSNAAALNGTLVYNFMVL